MKKLQLASLTLAALLLAAAVRPQRPPPRARLRRSPRKKPLLPPPRPRPLPSRKPRPPLLRCRTAYTPLSSTPDSSMFHANEAVDGMGTLTVENGMMTFHVSLQSQKIVNLYPGMAADAPAHESDWLQPTVDTVTYSDGTSDEVYGFDIPVAAVDADFQLAILGTKHLV